MTELKKKKTSRKFLSAALVRRMKRTAVSKGYRERAYNAHTTIVGDFKIILCFVVSREVTINPLSQSVYFGCFCITGARIVADEITMHVILLRMCCRSSKSNSNALKTK